MSPSEAIAITQEEKQEIQSVSLALPNNARSIQVTDYTTREAANEFFLKCREARKIIAKHYDPKIEEWKAAKKLADENRAKMVAEKAAAEAPIVEAEGIVNAEILRFDTQDKKRREEEQRAIEDAARKEAEEAALRLAQDVEAAGGKEEADAILEEAISAPVFAPPPPPPPKLKGSASYTIWKSEVEDMKALVMAVVSGKAPWAYIKANEVAIGDAVRSQKKMFRCPGVKIWSEEKRKTTGR